MGYKHPSRASVLLVANAVAPVPSFGITAAFLGGASTTIAAKQSAAPDETENLRSALSQTGDASALGRSLPTADSAGGWTASISHRCSGKTWSGIWTGLSARRNVQRLRVQIFRAIRVSSKRRERDRLT